jgi:hypothetical protein
VNFTVISTGFRVPPDVRARCVESVRAQCSQVSLSRHVYIDAEEQGPPRAHFQNLVDVISRLLDNEVVVSLDADDWLATPHALCTVARYFEAGALVTYGSFRFADGRPGCPSGAYLPGEDVRAAPWKGTHLKCFAAGLFKRIRHEDLKHPSERILCGDERCVARHDHGMEWLPHARDLALMFPLLEMAGARRRAHVSEVVYVYNLATSTEFTGDAATLAAERECVRYVRGLPPYKELP